MVSGGIWMMALKLSSKLSLFIVTGVIILVAIIGLYVDSLLKNIHYENNNKRMLHGFNRLSTDLTHDIANLHKSLASIGDDERFQASVDLINNYQDKKNYNSILLDEEKKIIAKELLSRVKLSHNDRIFLYDVRQELIAFVERQGDKFKQYFISYENGSRISFSKLESDELYTRNTDDNLYESLLKLNHTYTHTIDDSETSSFYLDDDHISVKAHLSLLKQNSESIRGYVEIDKIYDSTYFSSISSYLNMHISGTSDQAYSKNAFMLSKANVVKKIDMVQTDELFIGIASINTEDGLYFYHVHLDKKQFLATLTKMRQEFLVLTLFAVFFVLILLYYFFYKNLYSPLDQVMTQVKGLKNEGSTRGELEAISENVTQLISSAFNDELTGAYNRSYFKENIMNILDKNQGQTSIIFFDIDHFKQVNDTYGHDVGDIVLKEITELIQDHIRKEDKLIRWGGEEFVVIVKVGNIKELIEVAENLRRKVASYAFSGVPEVTCSFGCQLHNEAHDIMATLKRADELLYQAKNSGRNRVVSDNQNIN